jgi:hypothetical protein
MPISEADSGLTVHCNDEPMSSAGPQLGGHCALRKYAQQASSWFGICLRPSDTSLRFGVNLDYRWEPDIEMVAAASKLRKIGKFADAVGVGGKQKIGRNEPCPCGSGLK